MTYVRGTNYCTDNDGIVALLDNCRFGEPNGRDASGEVLLPSVRGMLRSQSFSGYGRGAASADMALARAAHCVSPRTQRIAVVGSSGNLLFRN